jgi:hypothetical protein
LSTVPLDSGTCIMRSYTPLGDRQNGEEGIEDRLERRLSHSVALLATARLGHPIARIRHHFRSIRRHLALFSAPAFIRVAATDCLMVVW